MRVILYILCCAAVWSSRAQTLSDTRSARPLAEVLSEVESRFGVQVRCKSFSADTVAVTYADFRIRPYSLGQTLDNLLHPLDLVWSGEQKIMVRPYEYYRRTVAQGEQLLAWLGGQYADSASWERRRAEVLRGVREALALQPFRDAMVDDPKVILGRPISGDGYTTRNYALETLPGLYVCGTVYAPPQEPLAVRNRIARGGRTAQTKRPLVVVPSGHWAEGRLRSDQQLLMATLARMGAIAVDMDIFGWGDSERQVGREAHTAPYAMQMQVLWSQAVADWVVASRGDIDTMRMAATGGSGGATHALMLAVVDDRFRVLAPVAHLVSHFDGGCPCESGRAVTLAAGGSCMPEILAAAAAPNPLLVVSDGGDWTASYPTLEYPFLRRIWGFYGAADRVRNCHLLDDKHDYGANKRRAVYEFLAETLTLDLSRADESRVAVRPGGELRSFETALPQGAIASRDELEEILKNLK